MGEAMKITIRRAGEDLVIEGEITAKGTGPGQLLDMQITGAEGEPWAEVEMEIADAIEIGAWGVTAWADRLRDETPAAPPGVEKT